MNYLDKLKALKESRHMTSAEISERSGVPLSTVNRIFSGQTPNPLFDNVACIVIALGGSLDDIVDNPSSDDHDDPTSAPDHAHTEDHANLLSEKDLRIRDLTASIMRLRKQNTRLLIFIGVFVSIVVLVLLFDMLNGHMGFIRYTW